MNPIDKYILDHTAAEDPLLKELFRDTHVKIMLPHMLSGHLQGKILGMITSMIKPQNVIEIGTYTGYSAISIAHCLHENAKIISIDINDELESFTRGYIDKSGLNNKIDYLIGDALKIIPKMNIEFEMAFIDGDKSQYIDYFEIILPKMKKGGFIIADNVLWYGKVIQPLDPSDKFTKGILEFNQYVHADPRVENVIFPIRDGLMVLRVL